jgi:histidinol-phosphate aminotransferase
VAACELDDFVRDSRKRLLQDRKELQRGLGLLGIETLPSEANFCLARAPNVGALRARLLSQHRILIRDCASFGLPGFMRLAAKPESERKRLLAALHAEGQCR